MREMTAEEFDKKFDEGEEDITDMLDMSKIRRPNLEQRRVNVDLPSWVIKALDREASRMGVTRQAVIKVWLTERLDGFAIPSRTR